MSPLFRMSLALILGILGSEMLNHWDVRPWIALIFVVNLLGVVYLEWQNSYFKQKTSGILVCGLFVWMGLYRSTDVQMIDSTHFSRYSSDSIKIVLEAYPERRQKSLRVRAQVESRYKDSLEYSCGGRLWVYFPLKDTQNSGLQPGHKLKIPMAAVQTVSSPMDPQEFDYRRYLERQQIYHQAFLHRYDYEMDSSMIHSLWTWSRRLQHQLISALKSDGFTSYRFSIASALLLGASDQIDPSTRATFQNVGVIHVLCVSGMHVGLLAAILSFMLRWLKGKSYTQWLKAFILVIALWLYACITGLAPSVVRATLMFSIITVGRAFRRQHAIIHSMGMAAMIQLLYDPMVLFNIGFQLSYVAVLGIVWIYPLWQSCPWRVLRWVKPLWELTGVSVAAQLATAPLCIYHFQQFPSYFVLSNWIASPLASLWMPLGLLWALCKALSLCLSQPIAWLCKMLIDGLFKGLQFIETWPGSLCTGLRLDGVELVLLYAILGSLLLGYERLNRWLVRSGVLMALVLGLWHISQAY